MKFFAHSKVACLLGGKGPYYIGYEYVNLPIRGLDSIGKECHLNTERVRQHRAALTSILLQPMTSIQPILKPTL